MTLSSSRTLAFAALPSFPVNEFPARASREVGGAGHPAPWPPPRSSRATVLHGRQPRESSGVPALHQESPHRARPLRPGQSPPPAPPAPASVHRPSASPARGGPGAHTEKRPKPPRLCAYLSARGSSSSFRGRLGSPATRTRHPGFPQRGVWAAYAAREEPRPERAPPSRPAAQTPASATAPPTSASAPPTNPGPVYPQ